MRGIFDCVRNRAFAAGFCFVDQIAGHSFIELLCARRQCLFGIDYGLQHAIVDFHQLSRISRSVGGICHHQRHRFADEADLAVRQHRPVKRARFHAVFAGAAEPMRGTHVTRRHGICASVNALHAGCRKCALRVDQDNFRMGMIRTHEVAVELPRHGPVGGIFAVTGDQALVFDPAAVVMMVVRIHVDAFLESFRMKREHGW